MNVNDIIISGIQEFFYFDIWEAFLMVLLMTIMVNKRISKSQYVFHSFMLGILDYIIGNLIIIPILMQIVCIIIYAIYFMTIFKINFIKLLIKTIEVFFIFFVIEVFLSIIYQYIFNIRLMSLNNNFIKFKYMIPFRIVEFIFVYIYYRFKNKLKVVV